MAWRVAALALILATGTPRLSHAAPASHGPMQSPAADVWQSWGGQADWRLNTDMLAAMGLRLDSVSGASASRQPAPGHAYRVLQFPARTTGALTFRARGQKLYSLADGALQYEGGFILRWPGGSADLRGFALRPHADSTAGPFVMDVVDSHGTVLFVVDHAHYGLNADSSRLSLRDMNIRLSPQLAKRLGRPQWSMRSIGGMDVVARVTVRGEGTRAVDVVCTAPWPTEAGPGQQTNIELFQKSTDSVLAMRCRIPAGGSAATGAQCTVPGTDGLVVIAPDSSLVDSGDTAVPWYTKFNADAFYNSGPPQPPYNNDQHPFLIWNLYRMDADGGIRQIGSSGVKHAFFTVNHNCDCQQHHAVYPTCEDTYSQFNNDDDSALGPRSEIIPAQGIWGRCGSVYDRDCNGVWDRDTSNNPVNGASDSFDLRLVASEADLDGSLNPGARYFLDYWYVVRDDDNIFDSMGYREVHPFKQAGLGGAAVWSMQPDALVLGPAIDAWVAPGTATTSEYSSPLQTDEGSFRVSVRVSRLPNGRWRYRYAVMNFDFARALIDPAHASEPNLKVLSNAGFDAMHVQLPSGISADSLEFADADRDSGNAWAPDTGAGSVGWTAPASGGTSINTLDWGTLYSFSFVASTAPGPSQVSLHVANTGAGLPTSYAVPSLGPRADLIFADGYEPQP